MNLFLVCGGRLGEAGIRDPRNFTGEWRTCELGQLRVLVMRRLQEAVNRHEGPWIPAAPNLGVNLGNSPSGGGSIAESLFHKAISGRPQEKTLHRRRN